MVVLLLLPLALTVKASDTVKTSYPIVKLQLERLPDLNTPRAGHAVFCVNGELTVAGGHTNGFVPTPTAEYFKDGRKIAAARGLGLAEGFAQCLAFGFTWWLPLQEES